MHLRGDVRVLDHVQRDLARTLLRRVRGKVVELTATVHSLPYARIPTRDADSLNLSPQEVQDAAGGYKRPADQLRELHARGFTRAYIPKIGRKRIVLERAHYDAVVRGQFSRQEAPKQERHDPAARTPLPPNRAGYRAKFGSHGKER